MSNTNRAIELAERILADRALRELCGKVGVRQLSHAEGRELVDAGLAYFVPNTTARGGSDMILNALGRLAARHARLYERLLLATADSPSVLACDDCVDGDGHLLPTPAD